MKNIEKLRKEGAKGFVLPGDYRIDELNELQTDALRAKQDYDRLCKLRPGMKNRYREQLRDTEWVIERAIETLMEGYYG